MNHKIVLGFHACVDYELVWNLDHLQKAIKKYNIYKKDLDSVVEINSVRNLLIGILKTMQEGKGIEFIPSSSRICCEFAENFEYKITIGGTAARAAIEISKLGYDSALSMISNNSVIKEKLPSLVDAFSNVGEETEQIYPHVVFSFPARVHVQINDIDFVTPRENRILFSRDLDSLNMVVSLDFASYLKNAEVMLVSCFNEIIDENILKIRMREVNKLLEFLPEDAYVIFEDGCYENIEFRKYVHKALKNNLDILSMNEDEMQDYLDTNIKLMDPCQVLSALEKIYIALEIPTLIVHTADWAIAYGKNAIEMEDVLKGGSCLAATRFCYGDSFGRCEFEKIKRIAEKEKSVLFSKKITEISRRPICCVPSKNLEYIEKPVCVGLGDAFAGGVLPGLLKENRKKEGKKGHV